MYLKHGTEISKEKKYELKASEENNKSLLHRTSDCAGGGAAPLVIL